MIIIIPIVVVLVIAFVVWWAAMKNKPKAEQEDSHLAERAAEILTTLPKKYQTVNTVPKSNPINPSQSAATDHLPRSDQEIKSNGTASQEVEIPYDMKVKDSIDDDIETQGSKSTYIGGESAEKVIGETEPHHQVIRHLQSESTDTAPRKKFHDTSEQTINPEDKITLEMSAESMTEGDVVSEVKESTYVGGESAEKTIEESAESHEGHDSDSSETD